MAEVLSMVPTPEEGYDSGELDEDVLLPCLYAEITG